MQVVIFANGEIQGLDRARLAAQAAELIIAADGGARQCLALGISPAVVIGDFDSLTPQQLQELEAGGAQLLRHPADKDQTDLELALHHARQRGAERSVVLGAAGGRLDMTLANVQLLAHPALARMRIELWHGDQTAFVVTPPGGELPGQPGDTLSLIPLGQQAAGIVTHDLHFALSGGALQPGPARGVSNRISGPHPSIELQSGTLLIVHTSAEAGMEDVDH